MTTLGERLTNLDREVLREVLRRAGEREGVVEALLDRNLQWAPQLERNRLLEEAAEAAWLDRDAQGAAALVPLLRPYPADAMRAYPVGLTVNNPRNDVPECPAPAP
jgi:hypothetical protein